MYLLSMFQYDSPVVKVAVFSNPVLARDQAQQAADRFSKKGGHDNDAPLNWRPAPLLQAGACQESQAAFHYGLTFVIDEVTVDPTSTPWFA